MPQSHLTAIRVLSTMQFLYTGSVCLYRHQGLQMGIHTTGKGWTVSPEILTAIPFLQHDGGWEQVL